IGPGAFGVRSSAFPPRSSGGTGGGHGPLSLVRKIRPSRPPDGRLVEQQLALFPRRRLPLLLAHRCPPRLVRADPLARLDCVELSRRQAGGGDRAAPSMKRTVATTAACVSSERRRTSRPGLHGFPGGHRPRR